MKIIVILILVAGSMLAAPMFWGHPNVQINLAEPALPFGQFAALALADLVRESPQNQMWYTGGLVGYFSNEWEAPIWTSTRIDWQIEIVESDEPPHEVFDSPVLIPSAAPPPVSSPPNTIGWHAEVTSVPEPGTWRLVTVSLIALVAAYVRWRPSRVR